VKPQTIRTIQRSWTEKNSCSEIPGYFCQFGDSKKYHHPKEKARLLKIPAARPEQGYPGTRVGVMVTKVNVLLLGSVFLLVVV